MAMDSLKSDRYEDALFSNKRRGRPKRQSRVGSDDSDDEKMVNATIAEKGVTTLEIAGRGGVRRKEMQQSCKSLQRLRVKRGTRRHRLSCSNLTT